MTLNLRFARQSSGRIENMKPVARWGCCVDLVCTAGVAWTCLSWGRRETFFFAFGAQRLRLTVRFMMFSFCRSLAGLGSFEKSPSYARCARHSGLNSGVAGRLAFALDGR